MSSETQKPNSRYSRKSLATVSTPIHNVYMVDYDSPVYKIALYMLQGNNRISMYIRRILAIPLVKSVVATGEYLRENHEFRV